jgi:Beta-propeller repeat
MLSIARQPRLLIAVLALAHLSTAALAELPYHVAWSKQIGTSADDEFWSVAVDSTGNAYATGETSGSLGGANAGVTDAILAKYNVAGNLVWSRQIGTSALDNSNSVAVDAAGNAFISGDTYGSLDGTNAGSDDAFLTKYDPAGTVLWSRQIGTTESDFSWSVAVNAGNAYITGQTHGSLGGTSAGADDAFLAKYDASGNVLWSRQIGTSAYDISHGVAVDTLGNAYISGYTQGSLGGTSAGGNDAFLAKYDASGNFLWARQIGTSADDVSNSVAVDAAGNAYITGQTNGVLAGSSAGSYDAFLAKFDAAGNPIWSRQIGTTSLDSSNSVALDAHGNPYISGITSGSLGSKNAGQFDSFLTKYNASGLFLWTRQIGTSVGDYSISVAVDAAGSAYIGGDTFGSLGGASAGNDDAFLVKFAPLVAFGDYDGDGTINANDYNIWKASFGTANAAADGNGNGIVDAADYTLWRDHLGQTITSGSSAEVPVPEPASAVLLAVAAATLLARRGHFETWSKIATRALEHVSRRAMGYTPVRLALVS